MAIQVDEELKPTQTDIQVNASVPYDPYLGYGSIGQGPTGVGSTNYPIVFGSDGSEGNQTPTAPTEEEGEEGTPTEETPATDQGYVNPYADFKKEPEPAAGGITDVNITDAPAYEQSEAEKAWAEMYGAKEQEILDKGGLGIDPETQALMKQQQFDLIEADKEEKLRNLKNTMETRGITNSFLFIAEESKIKATATRALAESVTNIQIQSALMKVSSFENALGRAANFLGYLSTQSQLAYAPIMATWNMKSQAKIATMQANVEIYKQKLNQCYTVNNMKLAAQIQADYQQQEFENNKILAQMEIDATQEMAKAEASGNIFGTIVGGLFSLLAFIF
jgi:hypothetical protein